MGISTSPSTGRRIARTLARVLVALAAIEAILVVVFRSKWPPVIRIIRRFNRAVLNPPMLRMAGSTHWYASVVHHVGRTSGKPYATPVLAELAGHHLYVPLPYGTHVDWLANVLAAGGCVVERKGERYEATAPAVVPAAEAAAGIPARQRRTLDLYGVRDYLRLQIAG